MDSSALSSGWHAFECLQQCVDTEILDADSLDAEEALTKVLDDFAAGVGPTADYVWQRFRSLRRKPLRGCRRLAAVAVATRHRTRAADAAGANVADELRFAQEQAIPTAVLCGG